MTALLQLVSNLFINIFALVLDIRRVGLCAQVQGGHASLDALLNGVLVTHRLLQSRPGVLLLAIVILFPQPVDLDLLQSSLLFFLFNHLGSVVLENVDVVEHRFLLRWPTKRWQIRNCALALFFLLLLFECKRRLLLPFSLFLQHLGVLLLSESLLLLLPEYRLLLPLGLGGFLQLCPLQLCLLHLRFLRSRPLLFLHFKSLLLLDLLQLLHLGFIASLLSCHLLEVGLAQPLFLLLHPNELL